MSMASTMISSGTLRNSSSKVPTITVGYSDRLMTSVRVLAGSSATYPVAASAAATPARMRASRAAWVGTT